MIYIWHYSLSVDTTTRLQEAAARSERSGSQILGPDFVISYGSNLISRWSIRAKGQASPHCFALHSCIIWLSRKNSNISLMGEYLAVSLLLLVSYELFKTWFVSEYHNQRLLFSFRFFSANFVDLIRTSNVCSTTIEKEAGWPSAFKIFRGVPKAYASPASTTSNW